ncbi:unnamed protein product [Haemonchus placei]|uniref:Complement component C8 gamma chain n=1 Tax=Haemonchus placei TaxID=6290 RepID=A0A0N4WPK2_HAEPC|nr:unnamed protein product [Haemonchus placei]
MKYFGKGGVPVESILQIEDAYRSKTGRLPNGLALTIAHAGAHILTKRVLLEAGKFKTIYPESVRCDGEWTFVDDNHNAQRIVNMICLDEAPQIEGDCSCSKLLRTQLCKDDTCEETAVDFSPDGCIAKFSCEKGFQLEISLVSREGKNDVAEVRKQFIVEDNPALTCSGGQWVFTTSGESVGLLKDEFLSCKAPLQPSLHLLEHEV